MWARPSLAIGQPEQVCWGSSAGARSCARAPASSLVVCSNIFEYQSYLAAGTVACLSSAWPKIRPLANSTTWPFAAAGADKSSSGDDPTGQLQRQGEPSKYDAVVWTALTSVSALPFANFLVWPMIALFKGQREQQPLRYACYATLYSLPVLRSMLFGLDELALLSVFFCVCHVQLERWGAPCILPPTSTSGSAPATAGAATQAASTRSTDALLLQGGRTADPPAVPSTAGSGAGSRGAKGAVPRSGDAAAGTTFSSWLPPRAGGLQSSPVTAGERSGAGRPLADTAAEAAADAGVLEAERQLQWHLDAEQEDRRMALEWDQKWALRRMTLAQLQLLARRASVRGRSRMNKRQLLQALEAAGVHRQLSQDAPLGTSESGSP